MGFPIVLGSGRGEVLLDLMGLFRVVRLEAYGERIVAEAIQLGFVGVLLLRREAWLLRTATPLRTTWSDEWVKGLLLMLNGVGDDPFKAEEFAERVFLRRVFVKDCRVC